MDTSASGKEFLPQCPKALNIRLMQRIISVPDLTDSGRDRDVEELENTMKQLDQIAFHILKGGIFL